MAPIIFLFLLKTARLICLPSGVCNVYVSPERRFPVLTKSEEKRIFAEACTGFGFEETEQHVDGLYCTGCMFVHKRRPKCIAWAATRRTGSVCADTR